MTSWAQLLWPEGLKPSPVERGGRGFKLIFKLLKDLQRLKRFFQDIITQSKLRRTLTLNGTLLSIQISVIKRFLKT